MGKYKTVIIIAVLAIVGYFAWKHFKGRLPMGRVHPEALSAAAKAAPPKRRGGWRSRIGGFAKSVGGAALAAGQAAGGAALRQSTGGLL